MTIDEIKIKLEDAFPGSEIELINTSSMHIGPNSKGYHLKTTIRYNGFKGLSLIQQHRLVQDALKNELNGIIANVVKIAIPIPIIPKRFPLLAVSGCDSPLRDNINRTAEMRYSIEE